MGDYSSIGITIFKDDIKKFRSVLEDHNREFPGDPYNKRFDEKGNLIIDIDQANSGWDSELKSAAEAELRFYGWDSGCIGAWAESEFCAIDGKIYSAVTPCDFGPMVRLRENGEPVKEDVRETMAFYKALKRVKKVMGL